MSSTVDWLALTLRESAIVDTGSLGVSGVDEAHAMKVSTATIMTAAPFMDEMLAVCFRYNPSPAPM